MASLTARLAAAMMGGNAVYSDLKADDLFKFPTNPNGTVFKKLRGGWYTNAAVPLGGSGMRPKFRTGRNTAVIYVGGPVRGLGG